MLQTGVVGSFENTPIVDDGVMYVTTPYDHVFAVDAKTGKELWHYQYKLGKNYICCGPNNPYMATDPITVSVGASASQQIQAYNSCTSKPITVTLDFPTWWTDNTSIATANGNQVTGVAAGSTNQNALSNMMYWGPKVDAGGQPCPQSQQQLSATVNVTCATPTNFAIYSESNLSDGSLYFTYTWSSSTGKQSDLANCTIGETVFYPGYPTTPYIWPLPMVQSTNNPTSISGKGSNTVFTDTNGPPGSYQQPYSATSFNATQRLWWACPCYQNGAVQYFVPDVTIARKIFKDTDGFWKYQITKSGYTNTVKLPNQ
jgi:hypothetical protein